MLKEVLGAVMAAFVGTLILWVLLPVLKNVQNIVFNTIDTSDPTTQFLISLGDIVYLMLGWVVILVVGFVILSYATRRDPYDTS